MVDAESLVVWHSMRSHGAPLQFGSVEYLIFLTCAAVVYFALPGVKSRTLWLLAASYFFYATLSASWTVVLLGVTAVGYVFGLLLDRSEHAAGHKIPSRTRGVLVLGIAIVLAVLFTFKYAGFASGALSGALWRLGAGQPVPLIRLALPVGISFWTFQTIAYLIDIARGNQAAERNVLSYGLFIAFFPQVSAGPIARSGQLLPQLATKHRFEYDLMRSGLLLMLWGFFKKLVVADPLAMIVNTVYGDPDKFATDPIVLIAATVAFSVQIYCDFSGYTDIVRGSARLFGVNLLPNFARPYEARSIREFWRRWHMSLMSWFKDYVYIPLGGSRVSPWRRRLNILAVFLVSGLWHGAGLTFVVWGLLNGLYQIVGEWLAPLRERVAGQFKLRPESSIRKVIATMITFGLVTIAWVFFRAESMADAFLILQAMLRPVWTSHTNYALGHIGLSLIQLKVVAVATATVFITEWISGRIDLPGLVYRQNVVVRWIIYQGTVMTVVIFGFYGAQYDAASFAYFKF